MGPNLLVVLSSFNSGVPVKATNAALGSACFMRIWFSPPWLRWPSSISTMMSELLFTHSGILVAVLNFWISEKMIRSVPRSDEHTSELQSRGHLVCRLLLAKKHLHATP